MVMREILCGWNDQPDQVTRVLASLAHPYFADAAYPIMGSGLDGDVLLYKAWKDALGKYPGYVAQAIGDCVSFGTGHAVDLLQCVQMAVGKQNEAFEETSTEAIYGMARVDIGGERGSHQDGAVGAWAAQAVMKIGTLSREKVGPYSGQRAKQWGADGVPMHLEDLAPQHKVRTTSLVKTWDELCAALANGYPVTVCSNQGFTMTRDANGFCSPRGHWGHCMMIAGIRRDIPGALICQSWGDNVPSGPTALDQPDFSFWADRRTVESMLACGDSWAFSTFEGYPGQVLPDRWSYEGFA